VNPLSLIPLPYRLLALALLAVACAGFGWVKGASHVQEKWSAANDDQAARVVTIQAKQAAATIQVVTEYVDRVQIVRQRGADIIKEVPIYVTKESDAGCVIPRGFVRLHDAAADGGILGAPGDTDAAPAGIALSTVAGTVTRNYQRCYENAAELTGLQQWVRAQIAAGQ